MDADMMENGVEVVERAVQPMLSIRTTIVTNELGERMGERFEALSGYLAKMGVKPAGHPFVIYHTFVWEGESDFEVGVPVAEKLEGEGWIASGELPGGPAVKTVHTGPHEELGKAYARISEWMKENGKEAASPIREEYYWIDLAGGQEDSSSGEQHVGLIQPYM
ncbi:MAG: GyrI-like domain-containing protein [Chloroflexia bacterium]